MGTQVIAFCYSSDTVRSHVYTGLNLSISSTNTDARTSAVKAVERTIGEAYEIVSIEGGYLVDTNDILVKNGSGFWTGLFNSLNDPAGLQTRRPTISSSLLTQLDQLSVEIQNIPSSARAPLSANLRQYRQSIQSAKKQLANVEQAGARNELFGDRSAAGDGDIALDQRQQLLSGQESSTEARSESETRNEWPTKLSPLEPTF